MLPSTISFVFPPSYVSPYALPRIIHHFHPDLRRHSHILQRHAMPKFPRDDVSWARTSIRVSQSPVSIQHHRQKGVKLTNSSHILEVPTVPSPWNGWKVTRKRSVLAHAARMLSAAIQDATSTLCLDLVNAVASRRAFGY
jgi:hypothetical protein